MCIYVCVYLCVLNQTQTRAPSLPSCCLPHKPVECGSGVEQGGSWGGWNPSSGETKPCGSWLMQTLGRQLSFIGGASSPAGCHRPLGGSDPQSPAVDGQTWHLVPPIPPAWAPLPCKTPAFTEPETLGSCVPRRFPLGPGIGIWRLSAQTLTFRRATSGLQVDWAGRLRIPL